MPELGVDTGIQWAEVRRAINTGYLFLHIEELLTPDVPEWTPRSKADSPGLNSLP